MSTTTNCHPMPMDVVNQLIQDVMRAVCVRPGEDEARCENRTRQLVHCTTALEPRDGLEYILSTLAFAHFNLILDSMRDAFQTQKTDVRAGTIKTILGLDRTLLAMIREYRLQRKRPAVREEAAAGPEIRATVTACEAPPAPPDVQPKTAQPPAPAPKPQAGTNPLDHLITVLGNVPKPDAGSAAWLAHAKAYEGAFANATRSGAIGPPKREASG